MAFGCLQAALTTLPPIRFVGAATPSRLYPQVIGVFAVASLSLCGVGAGSEMISDTSRNSNATSNQAMQLTASKPADLRLECLPSGAYAAWHAQRARGS